MIDSLWTIGWYLLCLFMATCYLSLLAKMIAFGWYRGKRKAELLNRIARTSKDI